MNKFIVTTTINPPTEATKRFAQMDGWQLIVVGDLLTPHEEYGKLNCIYLHPDYQDKEYRDVSETLGWKTIQRRNIGFLEAYKLGADVVATVDDDNIPYDDWGTDLYINKTIEVDIWEPEESVFDPLSITQHKHLWHRGYPVELLPKRHNVIYKGKQKRLVYIQADLWDGDPDIDAMARLIYRPCVKFNDITKPFAGNKIAPFNSQNTFLSREVLPMYAVLPHVGRMDDIWGAYLLQMYYPNHLIFNRASVYQDRNPQDLIANLQAEIGGYRNTLKWTEDFGSFWHRLDERTQDFWKAYTTQYARMR